MTHLLSDLKTFLDCSPTSWHTVKQIGNRLSACDFFPLNELSTWSLEPGKKYFIERGGSICAFVIPKNPPKKTVLIGSHTDSPSLKLKPNPCFIEKNMALCGIEVYGNPLLNSWLNRDLKMAGRAIIMNHQGIIEERLVLLDDLTLSIPQLALHLNREVNEKGLLLNKQTHLCPLIGLFNENQDPSQIIENLLRRSLSFKSLISYELFLVPTEPARFVGYQNEMLASYRLDNLASVHASISAMAYLDTPSSDVLQMAICWDHEEIGSHTKEGAASPFLSDILQRIGFCLKLNTEEMLLLKNHSLCISIDMAHALHPGHIDKHDANHQVLLGKGVAVKYNAHQKYAGNALCSATLLKACHALNIDHQAFVSRTDMPCGNTVGSIIAEKTGIDTVDIGIPQLSMHSIREIIACQDYLDLCRLLTFLLQEV